MMNRSLANFPCQREKYPRSLLRVTEYRIASLREQSLQRKKNFETWTAIKNILSSGQFLNCYTISDLESIQEMIIKDDYMSTHYQGPQCTYLTQPLSIPTLLAFLREWLIELFENDVQSNTLYDHFMKLRRKIRKVNRIHRRKECSCQHGPARAA